MKACEADGCTAPIPLSDTLCGHCAMRAANEESECRTYAANGLRELERYLQLWAEFEARYGPN
jgi:hypothetical protein